MRVRKFGLPFLPNGFLIQGGPVYSSGLTEAQLTIAATPGPATVLWSNQTPPRTVYAILRNSSTGGQIIRAGVSPTFTGPSGLLLMPGDTVDVVGITLGFSAMGNVAGGLLDVEAFHS